MTDFETYRDLHAKRDAVFRRLDQKARQIYAVFAPEKDKVSTARFPWVRRSIEGVRFGPDFFELTVQHFLTKFAGNGMCYLEYPQHKLKLPAAMLDLEGEYLLDAINVFLQAEADRMTALSSNSKAA